VRFTAFGMRAGRQRHTISFHGFGSGLSTVADARSRYEWCHIVSQVSEKVGYNAFNAKGEPVEAIVLGLSSAVLSDLLMRGPSRSCFPLLPQHER
jgi:hypothetical protein